MARMTPWTYWFGTPRGVALSSLLAVAVGITAVARLAATSDRLPQRREYSAAEQEARRSKSYYERAWSGVRIVQLRDSLSALARPGVSFLLDPRIPREERALAEERLRAAWGAFAIDSPRVPVVLYIHAATARSAQRPFADPTFASLPTAPGAPCVVVLARLGAWRTVARDARRFRTGLYGCALLAEHGMPGAAVRGELRRIAWAPVPLNIERRFWYYSIYRTTLGTVPWGLNESAAAYLACVAGKISACEEIAQRPPVRSREFPPGTGRESRSTHDASMLALLKASLSPANFTRLWRDERPFAVAVDEISGRSTGEWMQTALLRASGPLRASFASTVPISGRALIYLLLAAAATIAVQSRRTVR